MEHTSVKRGRDIIFALLRILIAVALLVYLGASGAINWSAARVLISTPWLLPGVGCLALIGASIESIRLGFLFRPHGIHLTFHQGFRLVSVATFFNFYIPGGTGGDVMKLYYLASENRGRAVEVATLLVADRAVALLSFLSLVSVLGIINVQFLTEYPVIGWLVASAGIGIAAISMVGVISWSSWIRASRFYDCLTTRVPLGRFLKRAADVLWLFRDRKRSVFAVMGLSMLGHLALIGMFISVGKVMVPSAPAIVTPMLALLGMLANTLPLTPGGLGVGETAFNQLFSMAGFANGAFLLLAWRLGTLPVYLIGCFIYIFHGRRGRIFGRPQELNVPIGAFSAKSGN